MGIVRLGGAPLPRLAALLVGLLRTLDLLLFAAGLAAFALLAFPLPRRLLPCQACFQGLRRADAARSVYSFSL